MIVVFLSWILLVFSFLTFGTAVEKDLNLIKRDSKLVYLDLAVTAIAPLRAIYIFERP